MKGVHRLNTSRLQQTKQQRIHPSPSDVSSTFLPIAYVGCAVDIHISQKNHFLSLFCPAEFVYFLIKRAMPKSRLSLCIWIPSNSLEFLQVISSPPVSIIQVPVLMLNWEIKDYYIAMCTRGTSALASDNLIWDVHLGLPGHCGVLEFVRHGKDNFKMAPPKSNWMLILSL